MNLKTNSIAFSILFFWPTCLWFFGLLEFFSHILFARPTSLATGWSVWLAVGLGLWAGFKIVQSSSLNLKEQAYMSIKRLWEAPVLLKGLIVVAGAILILALLEARLPPHLPWEGDAIAYHMTLPKQHLLHGTIQHLSWSARDLWPMPVQWGFASFWFLSPTYHKIPQFIATLWALGLLFSLSRSFDENHYLKWIPALAFVSTHGVMFQLGTAMMDLANLYFLMAFLYANHKKKRVWAALHLAVFATSKAFMPLQTVAGALICYGLYLLKTRWDGLQAIKKHALTIIATAVFAMILLSRSVWIGIERAGTPLFPFATCLLSVEGCQGKAGEIIRKSSELQLEIRDQYGYGRDLGAFLSHFWLVSVPTRRESFNNEYDYPLGLGWLLCVILLFASIPLWMKQRSVPFFVVLAIGFWITWWLGSQQSRWLYPVLALGWIGTMETQKKINPHVLTGVLLISALFSLWFQWRALSPELWKKPAIIQNEQITKVQHDPKTGLLLSKHGESSLYVNEPIETLAPGDLSAILVEGAIGNVNQASHKDFAFMSAAVSTISRIGSHE